MEKLTNLSINLQIYQYNGQSKSSIIKGVTKINLGIYSLFAFYELWVLVLPYIPS